MAKSKIDIANQALLLINEDEIQNFEQASTNQEKVLKRFFEDTYEEVCSEFTWNFCTKAAALAESESTPIGWSNSFAIPNAPKTLRVVSIESVGFADPDWERRGDELMINQGDCSIKYIYKVEDITRIPAHVVRCISTLLASRIAIPLLGVEGQGLASYYQQLYTGEVRPNAQILDANEGKQLINEESNIMGGNFVNGTFVPSGANYGVYLNAAEQTGVY